MPIIEKIVPGSFCWIELATSDQDAAKQFYGALFGWTWNDFPMGPSGTYTIWQLQGRDNGGAFTIMGELKDRGVPPHWELYIAVADVEESTKQAVDLGAAILKEPFDVMDQGRMSVIRDPIGAVVCLWQTRKSTGLGYLAEPGALCWADLLCQDRDKARRFYESLLGWKFMTGEGKQEPAYWHIVNGDHGIGGMPPREFLPPEVHPHWSLYFQVTDCAASTAKATSLGAKTIVPPMDIEGAGRMAVLADPQNASFAIFQPGR